MATTEDIHKGTMKDLIPKHLQLSRTIATSLSSISIITKTKTTTVIIHPSQSNVKATVSLVTDRRPMNSSPITHLRKNKAEVT